MKKSFLLVFILVFGFHNLFEFKDMLALSANVNSFAVSCDSQPDDICELITDSSIPDCHKAQIRMEPSSNLPKENYNPIWKPPINS